jgi:hypothetical protein
MECRKKVTADQRPAGSGLLCLARVEGKESFEQCWQGVAELMLIMVAGAQRTGKSNQFCVVLSGRY